MRVTDSITGYGVYTLPRAAIARAKRLSIERLHLGAGARALEVGCGTGDEVTAMAARIGRGGAAVGIDVRPQLANEARAAPVDTGSLRRRRG